MKTLVRSLLLASVVGSAATSAAAQGLVIDGVAGYQDLTRSRNSAKAIFDGKSGGLTYGGGLGFELGNGLFVSAWFRNFSKDGERVFVENPGGPVFRLGHPLNLKVQPLQATVGYRFASGSAVSPYIGGGGGVTRVEESSTVGGVTDKSRQTKGSFHALVGVVIGRGSLSFGAEAMYLSAKDTAGFGGVSAVYDENDIGGFSAVGKVRFRFGH